MLGWFRGDIIRRLLASLVLVTYIVTNTTALAAVNAQQDVVGGQSEGLNFLGGAQSLPSVTTGTAGLDGGSTNNNIVIGDFLQGASGAPDSAALQSLSDNPDGLVAAGMVLRTVQNEGGCRKTNFTKIGNQQPLIRIEAFWRYANGTEAPATYSGKVPINFPSLGLSKRHEIIMQPVDGANPALVLKYELTPYAKPANEHFVYMPSIAGAVTGSFTSIGGPENNFTLQGDFVASNASVIVIKGDLYKITRDFEIKPICDPDPQTSCLHNGIDICNAGTASLQKYFVTKSQFGENDVGVVALDLARKGSNAKDPEAELLAQQAAGILDGTDPLVSELFQGCVRTDTSSYSTITQHVDQFITCQSLWGPSSPCQQERKIHANLTGRTKVVTLSGSQVYVGDGEYHTPTYEQNIRVNVTMPPAIGPSTGPLQTLWVAGGGRGGMINNDRMTDGGADTFWIPFVTSPNYDDAPFSSYGDQYNNFAPTINIRFGITTYQVTYREYRIVQDENINSGTESCQYIDRAIQDNWCPSEAAVLNCVNPKQNMVVTTNDPNKPSLPMTGLTAFLDPLTGNIPGMAPDCWVAMADPKQCQPANLHEKYLGNVLGGSWLDNCSDKGRFLDPLGVSHSPKCSRLPDKDICTDVGANTNTCYQIEVMYDCGEDKERDVTTMVHIDETCGSPIRCLGTECGNSLGEANGDLAQAMAAGNMMDAMQQDIICEETGQPPTSPYDECSMRIFTGEPRECTSAAVSGAGIAPDCCEEGLSAASSQGIGPTQAMYAFDAAKKLATNEQFLNMVSKVPGSSYVSGAWEATKAATKSMADAVTSVARKVGQKVLGQATEEAAKEAMKEGIGGAATGSFTNFIYTNINNFLQEIGLDAIGNLVFEAGATAGTTVLTSGASMILGALNIAMMVYSIAQLLGQLLYGCTEEEYELGMERAKKNCHKVGQYCSKEFPSALGGGCEIKSTAFCCYKSPLNRIIAEQMRETLGGYGSPEDPICEGFTLEEINAYNWDTLDLSEWNQLLHESGILPETDEQAENMWGMDADESKIISNGVSQGADGKVSAKELLEERIGGLEQRYEDARNELSTTEACSYNGGIQWWGEPEQFRDDSEVDVYLVKKTFEVSFSSAFSCSGGSDGEAYYRVAPFIDIDPETNQLVSSYVNNICDGHIVGINPDGVTDFSYVSEKYFYDGVQIPELPDDLVGQECRATPDNAGWTSYVGTYYNNIQQVKPDCKATGTTSYGGVIKSGWRLLAGTRNIEVTYQLRRVRTVATANPGTVTDCINPND